MTRTPTAATVVLDALGDPTRREVLHLLRHGPRTVGDLAGRLPVTRPAVSQHLRVLQGAHLVTATKQGRERWYQVDRRGLAALQGWLEEFWTDVLDAFAVEAAHHQGRTRG